MPNTDTQQAALDSVQAQFDRDNAALETAVKYSDELTTDLAEAQTAQENAEVSLAASETARMALQAEFDAYKASHPDPAPVFEFGLITSVNGIDDKKISSNVNNRFGPKYALLVSKHGPNLGPGGKWFDYGDGIAAAIQHRNLAKATERSPLYCVKGWSNSAVLAFLDSLTVPVRITSWQEWENDMSASALTARDRPIRALIDGHPNGHLVELQMVGMGSNEDSSKGPAAWEGGLDFGLYDSGGFDLYNAGWRPALLTPDRLVYESLRMRDAAVKVNPDFKLRASEVGIARAVNQPKGQTGTALGEPQRLQVFKDTFDTFQAEGFASADYWPSDNHDVNSDWTYLDQPSIVSYLTSLISA